MGREAVVGAESRKRIVAYLDALANGETVVIPGGFSDNGAGGLSEADEDAHGLRYLADRISLPGKPGRRLLA